jgi:MerR family transcriptional regulator, copper efflux regulator
LLVGMTALTIQDVSRRSGLSEPTLRYYEEIGLIGPIERDGRSGHRRYRTEDLTVLEALSCLRATGMSIDDMRTYRANLPRGHAAAAEQRDLLARHVRRVEAELAAQQLRLEYLRAKAALWEARAAGDTAAEADARDRMIAAYTRMYPDQATAHAEQAAAQPAVAR